MIDISLKPSEAISTIIAAAEQQTDTATGITAMMQRVTEFPSPIQAKLTGIAVDPAARAIADRALDAFWSDEDRRENILADSAGEREVIIGSGFHAAVYAAIRVLSGFPKPLVIERSTRVGGTFAMTERAAFYLNSRNRPGTAGLAGDLGVSLNYLPGAPIQASNVSMAEYQTNTDMAFVIRLTLAQFADVINDATIVSASREGANVDLDCGGGLEILAGRVIDARGVGDPIDENIANGSSILTFGQFMTRMAGLWPLRGIRRVAVIGGGDAGKCTVESLLGIGPSAPLAAAALDSVDHVDWYASDLPTQCDGWQEEIRGRYQAIGRYLRPDRFGARRLTIVQRQVTPTALPSEVLIGGRSYDMVVLCTGNRETEIDGLYEGDVEPYVIAGSPVAQRYYNLPAFRVGPHAQLPFTSQEREEGVAEIAANAVSMFRLATKTAALAATLRRLALP